LEDWQDHVIEAEPAAAFALGQELLATARSIDAAKGTLLNRERGHRQPTGPAQALLAMIAKKPSLVRELPR
jgi:DNA-binding transcriptional regulator YiaG